MEGANADEPFIARVTADVYVSHLRMEQSPESAAIDNRAAADSRPYRNVGERPRSESRPEVNLSQRRGIHIDAARS